MLPPDEARRLVGLVDHGALERELRNASAEAHDALEPEGRLPAASPESHSHFIPLTLDGVVVPGQRRHLTVKRDPVAAMATGLVDAREELLPAAFVVPQELVVTASLERLRARRLKTPRPLEEDVDLRRQVDEFVDVGALLGQDCDAQLIVLEDETPPALNASRRDPTVRHRSLGGSRGCTSSPSVRSPR